MLRVDVRYLEEPSHSVRLTLAEKHRTRACGVLVLSIMGIFNAFVIYDCGKKFMKFCGPPKLRRRFTSSAALVDAPSDGAPPPASPPRLRRRPGSSRGA